MSDLQNTYRRLLERAAAAGFVAAGGVTPREACGPLGASLREQGGTECLSAADSVAELTDLVERCAYAERGTPAEHLRALQLCDAVGRLIPEVKPPRASQWAWLPNLGAELFVYALVIALGAAVVWLLISSAGSFTFGVPAINSSTASVSTAAKDSWQGEQAAELSAIEAHTGAWSCPARDVTWQTHRIAPTLRDAPRTLGSGVNLDCDTGTDGVFIGAADPFTPALHWTHRRLVFDRVTAQYEFQLAAPSEVTAAGSPHPDGETYMAEVTIEARRGRPIPVPSPGPDAVVVDAFAEPATPVRFLRDTGDGLHVVCERSGTVELRYTCSVHHKEYDNAPVPETPFAPQPSGLPANIKKDAKRVIEAIGGLPASTYAGTVRRLHAYFAGFSVAPIQPGEQQDNDYLTVALSRKGVCRHRARSFFITANALGVPTRLVENRCHSFCEVQLPDGSWRRLEFRLGEEGPPGMTLAALNGAQQPFSPMEFALLVGLPLGLVGFVLFSAWRIQRTESMQLGMHAWRGDTTVERAQRDDRLRRLAIGENLRMMTLAEAGAHGQGAPMMIARRIDNLAHQLNAPSDAFEMQRLYWDCLHIMRWINRKGEH